MIGAKPHVTKFYEVSQYIKEILKTYDDNEILLEEWMSLDVLAS